MNVVIYTQSHYSRNTFVNALIPAGINIFHAELSENLVYEIKKHIPDIIILDVVEGNFNAAFEVVKLIKNAADKDKKTGIIFLVNAIDKPTIDSAVQTGVSGFIKSNSAEDVISKYIIDTCQKVCGAAPERKLVRIKIEDKERASIKFQSPVNSQFIIGSIKDISYGGIAIDLAGTFPPESLSVGLEINNLKFNLSGKEIIIDGVVVAYQKNVCAFRFKNMSIEIGQVICQYIFSRLPDMETAA